MEVFSLIINLNEQTVRQVLNYFTAQLNLILDVRSHISNT